MRNNGFPTVAGLLALIMVFAAYCAWPRPAEVVMGRTDSAFVLVIDPGHGGEDGGAVSVSGERESALNLAIAKKSADLAALLGINYRMTRNEDISIHTEEAKSIAQKKVSDLKNRVRTVNGTPGAILLSIHQNQFPDGKYSGAQVFFAGTPGSEELARMLQSDIRTRLDPKNRRECKPAQKVFIMEKVNCPAILVECGFLSNRREEEMLRQDAYQKKLAMTMLRGIALMGRNADNNEI